MALVRKMMFRFKTSSYQISVMVVFGRDKIVVLVPLFSFNCNVLSKLDLQELGVPTQIL